MGTQLQTSLPPSIEVVGHGNSAAGALGGAHRPVLVEGAGALDGGRVDALRAVDVVGAAVGSHAAHAGGACRRVVGAEALDHVVLDQRVAGPAVDCEVGVAVGSIVGCVVDDPVVDTGVPAC